VSIPRRPSPGLVAGPDRAIPAGSEEEWRALEFGPGPLSTRLRLGPLAIACHCDDATLGAALRATWAGFLAPDDRPADVDLALHGVDRFPFPSPSGFAATAERGGAHLVKLRGMIVAAHPADGTARALVAAADPVRDLSNLIRVLLWTFAPGRDCFVLHAAAVERDGEAVLFFGPSHAGKSTVARLSAPRPVLTDDLVLLTAAGERVRAATAGLWGVEGSEGLVRLRRPVEMPVAAGFHLRQAAANRVRPLRRAGAALALLEATTLVRRDATAGGAALALASALAARLPLHEIEFSDRDGSFWTEVEQAIGAS
jgi:hypothetical protein